ncbi:MAG TPA: phosphomannose isomerase type II C-terminal cupin domain [Candidatus Binataceae bacterium]|nr:phosphomannose isomerase type II C-terminal cupin domain [Candidatus Binataceae bacterium]
MSGHKETARDDRPWGYYRILDEGDGYKVKQLLVRPGHRLSLQRHKRRAEHWYVVEGTAVVTRNDEEIKLSAGGSVDIPRTAWHRVMNPGKQDLIFVEVQTGDYFGEDDIERRDDDYGRR